MTEENDNLAVYQLAKEKAEEDSRLKTEMVSLVSHEYTNILTSMQLAVKMLKTFEPEPLPAEKAGFYEVLERSIQHLIMTTSSFLTLERIESGKLRLDIRPTLMHDLARDTLSMLEPITRGKGIRIALDFPKEPLNVNADPGALSVVVSNLLSNAVKYTRDGGSITLRIARETGPRPVALFAVEDTGIGISKMDQRLIFSGFRRVDDGRELTKGTGVGLKLAQMLVEAHGAKLELESEPGRGSRFFFRLPIIEPVSPPRLDLSDQGTHPRPSGALPTLPK
jgi:signal transduction histidine kinase